MRFSDLLSHLSEVQAGGGSQALALAHDQGLRLMQESVGIGRAARRIRMSMGMGMGSVG